MYQTNPTEMFREHDLALLREAEDRRLARRPRKASSKGQPRSGGWQGSGGRSPCGDRPACRSSGLRGSRAERARSGACTMNERLWYTADTLSADSGNHHHHLRAGSEEEVERRMRKRHPEAVAVSERPEKSWLQILWSTGPVP